MDPPLADVVSFADKVMRRGERPPAETDDEARETGEDDASVEPADLARQAMVRRLGQLARRGPAAGSMRSVDDELAILVYDSAASTERGAAVRSARQPGAADLGDARQLTFQGSELLIEVELNGSGREMTCQVVPPQPVSLEIRHAGGTIDLGADDFGTFHVAELPDRSISLRCVPLRPDAETTATSWITV